MTVEHEPLWGDTSYEFMCGYCGRGVESYQRTQQPSWQEVTQLALLQLITSYSLAHETRLLAELKRLGALPGNATVGDIPVQASLDSVLNSQDVPPRRHLAIAVFHTASAIADMVDLMAPVLLYGHGGRASIPMDYRPCLEGMISNVPHAFAPGQGRVFAHGGYWTLTNAGVVTGFDDFLPPAVGMIAVLQEALISGRFAHGGLVDARLPPAALELHSEAASTTVDPLMQQALNPNLGQGFKHSSVNANSAALPLAVISAAGANSRSAASGGLSRTTHNNLSNFGQPMFSDSQQEECEVLRALNGEEPQLSLQALLKAQTDAVYLHVATASGAWRQAFVAAAASGRLPSDTSRLVDTGDKRSFIYTGATVWGRVPLSWVILRLHSGIAADALAAAQLTSGTAASAAAARSPSPHSRSESALSGTDAEEASEDSSSKRGAAVAARTKLNKLLINQRQHHVWWPMQVAMPPSTSGSLTSTIPFLCDEHLWLESHDLLPLSKTPLKSLRAQLAVAATERAAAEERTKASATDSPALQPTSTPERRLNPSRDGRNMKRGNRSSQALGQLPLAMRAVFFDAVCTALVTCLLHCVPGSVGSVLSAALQAADGAPASDPQPGGSIDALAAVATMVGASYSAQGSSDIQHTGAFDALDAPAECLLTQLGVVKTAIIHAVKTTSISEAQSPVVRQALLQASGLALRLSFQGAHDADKGGVLLRGEVTATQAATAAQFGSDIESYAESPEEASVRTVKVRCVYTAPDKTHGAFSAAFAPVRTGSLPPVVVRMPAAVAILPQQDARWSFDEQMTPAHKSPAGISKDNNNGEDGSGLAAVEFVPRAGLNATAAAQLLRASGVLSTGGHVGSIGLLASGEPPLDAASSQRERDFKRSLCGLFLGAKCSVDGKPMQVGGAKRSRDADSEKMLPVMCTKTNIDVSSALQVSTLEDEAAAPGAIAPARVLGDLLPSVRQEVLDGLELGSNKRRRLQRMWRTPLVQFGCSHILHDEWLSDETVTGVLAPTDVAGVSTTVDSDEDSDCASISSESSRTWALAALDSAVGFLPGMHKSDRLSHLVGHHVQLTNDQRKASAALVLVNESTLSDCNPLASTQAANMGTCSLQAVEQAHLASYFATALRYSASDRHTQHDDTVTADSADDERASVLSADSLAQAWQLQSSAQGTGRRSRRYADGTADTTAADGVHSSGEGGVSSSSVSVTSSDLGGEGDVTLLAEAGRQRDGPLAVPLDVAQADVLRRHIAANSQDSSGPQLRKLFLAGVIEAFRQSASSVATHAGALSRHHHAGAVSADSSPSSGSQSQDAFGLEQGSAPGGSSGPMGRSAGPAPPASSLTQGGREASLSSGAGSAAHSLQSAGASSSLKSGRSAASSTHSKPRANSTDGGAAGSVMSGVTGDSDEDSEDDDDDDVEVNWEDGMGGPTGPRSLRKLEESGIFVIERIIRHKTVKRKRRFYVKWRGYGSENNSWVWGEDILDKDAIQEYDVQRKQRKATRIQRMRRGCSSINPSIVATKESRRKESRVN